MSDDFFESETTQIPPGFEPTNWSRGFGRQIGPFYERNEPDGRFTRAFLVAEHDTNGLNNSHGGMLMAFADMLFGHPVGVLKRSHNWVTVRMLTDFVSPARLGEWVERTAEGGGVADDLYTVRGCIWAGERLIMSGTGDFKMIAPRAEAR
jgi:acyl-coenzyme A thioesterase PaaI-like protein